MNNLTLFLLDLSGTNHGIHGIPVYLQKECLDKNVVCQRKKKQYSLKIAL